MTMDLAVVRMDTQCLAPSAAGSNFGNLPAWLPVSRLPLVPKAETSLKRPEMYAGPG